MTETRDQALDAFHAVLPIVKAAFPQIGLTAVIAEIVGAKADAMPADIASEWASIVDFQAKRIRELEAELADLRNAMVDRPFTPPSLQTDENGF